MTSKPQQLAAFLSARIAQHEERRQALQLDDRRDEATFERISGNVYDIFRSVLNAASKPCNGDEAAIGTFFLTRAQQIPCSWQAAYQQAQAHGEVAKMHIERIKLEAMDDILAQFHRIWGEHL